MKQVKSGAAVKSKSLFHLISRYPHNRPFPLFWCELDVGMRATVVCAIMRGRPPPFEFSCYFYELRPEVPGNYATQSFEFLLDSDQKFQALPVSSKRIVSLPSKSVQMLSLERHVPKIVPFHFAADLDVGTRVSVQCTVMVGNPPFDFAWFKDGQNYWTHVLFQLGTSMTSCPP
ncbi:titin [Caerostris extrusa]|uniref:Titin n=1 Tax=Caerostris extrusa TaxID=172846 RepID=A0AAV4TDG5_CAEEX|nr:titin [Caerostris extrusa]